MKRRKTLGLMSCTKFSGVTILVVMLFGLTACTSSNACSEPARFGFEEGMMDWVAQTYETSQGVIEIAQSSDFANACEHALKLTLDLEGGHPNRQTGEAFVEIPFENIEDQTITVWVYLPKDAVGDPQNPNGLQVFVKDKDWKGEYGTWLEIYPEVTESWQAITLTPGKFTPSNGYMDPGFDPTQIRAVGLKIAIGSGSAATYNGPIYIDSVNWP